MCMKGAGMCMKGAGHACRYGASFLDGFWYASNVHVIHLTSDSRLWGWLDQEAIVPEQGALHDLWVHHFTN